MAILSQRGYARHRGCALAAVQKAISTRRISIQADGSIDSDQADIEWRQNTVQRQPSISERVMEDDDVMAIGGSQYRKARAVREHYQARLAKLEYEERKGTLLCKDDVEIAVFNMGRQCRDRMLNIPDRVAAMLATENDPAKCYEILEAEIREALTGFADSYGSGEQIGADEDGTQRSRLLTISQQSD